MGSLFELTDSGGASAPDLGVVPQPGKDWIENYQIELDAYYGSLKSLNAMDPSAAFQTLSSISARVSEMRSQVMRVDSVRCTQFRTRQIDPFLEEVDRQFRTQSRIQTIRDLDYRVSRGEY